MINKYDEKWLKMQAELREKGLLWEQWPPERMDFAIAYWCTFFKWYLPFSGIFFLFGWSACGTPDLFGWVGSTWCSNY